MIDLYTADTPNGYRVELMLNEVDLDYTKHKISLSRGENMSTEFRQINPSSRIPVIIDHETEDGEKLVLTQSSAILIYLAEKSGKLLSKESSSRARTFEWLSFDASDIATTRFDAFYLSRHNNQEGEQCLLERIMEYYAIYDQHLASHPFLSGEDYSIADVAAYPWAKTMKHVDMEKYHNLQRWLTQIAIRSAVKKTQSDNN